MMTTTRTAKSYILGGAAILAMALLLACLFAAPAFANKQYDAPTTVSDDITRIHVNKLDADTSEYVIGARMAIINEETGEIVDEWVTGEGTHQNEKGLNVNVVYILRELEAPEGYGTVEDVRFVVDEMEGNGIHILSQGNDSEQVVDQVEMPLGSYKVNLYDKAVPIENEIVVTRPAPENPSKTVAPKTGDEAPLNTVALLVVAGIVAIAVLQVAKVRVKE